MGLPQPEGYLYWYTTSAILGVLTAINVVNIVIRQIARRSGSTLPLLTSAPNSPSASSGEGSMTEKDVENVSTSRQLGPARRFSRAFKMGADKFIGLSTVPLPHLRFWVKRRPARSIATTELLWTLVYTLGCLILSFYGTDLKNHKTYANQAAWISAAQMPLIIALAGKNNLISFLTGIGYEKLNFLHRAAGRVCFLGVWIHAGAYFYILEGFDSGNWATSLSRWGFTGLLAFTLLNVTSLRYVRQKIYEFFLITHILLAALTLAAFIMHWRAVDIWIYPGIGLWAADRLFRILRLFILNKLWTVIPSPTAANLPSTATLTLLTPSTLKISFETPSKHLSWSAGQHFYVVMPGMARLPWEAHPFTASTIPKHPGSGTESGELTFIVRVRDGFTKRMKQQVDKERRAQGLGVEEECNIEVKAAVEGPYGHVRTMDMYDGVLVVAGGSGISFAVSHLLQVIRDAKDGKPHPRKFSIIWMVKSRLHLNWIAPILLAHAENIPSTLQIALHVHVTRHYIPRPSIALAPTSALPADPSSAGADDSWQAYLAKRAAEPPRRKSRLMSTMSWATWTDPFDTEAQTGPGTRRGSTAVLPGQVSRSAYGDALPVEVEKQETTDQPFTWEKGYNEGETVAHNSLQFGGQIMASPLPQSPVHKASSGPPSVATLPEDEEFDIQSNSSYDGGPKSQARDRSSFSKATIRSSIAMPESPRRASIALNPSPLNPHSARRRSSAGILLATPPKRNISISIEEPIFAGRRRSSAHSAGTTSSPGDSRRGSLVSGPPRKSSGLLNVTLPVLDDSPPVDSEDKDPMPSMFNILPPTPLPDGGDAVLEMPAPAFFDNEVAPNMLSAPIMIKSSSQTSGISVRTASSFGSTPGSSIAPLIRPHSPGGSSGILTPALSAQKTDLSMPSDPENPTALLEQAFAESSQERAKQSIGLERVVHWHEGRADLHKAIEEMMVAVGKGATVNVEACGPRSLLDKAKDVVKDLSDMKAVWQGETRVVYHAETFGW